MLLVRRHNRHLLGSNLATWGPLRIVSAILTATDVLPSI